MVHTYGNYITTAYPIPIVLLLSEVSLECFTFSLVCICFNGYRPTHLIDFQFPHSAQRVKSLHYKVPITPINKLIKHSFNIKPCWHDGDRGIHQANRLVNLTASKRRLQFIQVFLCQYMLIVMISRELMKLGDVYFRLLAPFVWVFFVCQCV